MSVSKTSMIKVATAEKRITALDLRKSGKSLQYIADKLQCSKTYVHKLITNSLKELAAQSETMAGELRELESLRLDDLWNKAYALATKGDIAAINTCIKISERRSKLYGLDLAKGPIIENTFNAENNETEVIIYIPDNNRD